jgi:hypothetical protein
MALQVFIVYFLHYIRMKVSLGFSVGSLMAVSTNSHEVLNDILALAPAVDVVDVLGPLAAHLAGHNVINAEAEVIKVDGAVVCHG